MEEETHRIVQDATLTEQLLQYSKPSFLDDNVQAASTSPCMSEHDYDHAQLWKSFQKALILSPGVT